MEICQDRLKLYIGQVAYFLDHGVWVRNQCRT